MKNTKNMNNESESVYTILKSVYTSEIQKYRWTLQTFRWKNYYSTYLFNTLYYISLKLAI